MSWAFGAVIVAVFILSAGISSVSALNHASQEYVPGELIVKFKKPPAYIQGETLFRTRAGSAPPGIKAETSAEKETGLSAVYKIRLPKGLDPNEAARRYMRNPDVEYAEPNYIYKISETVNDPFFSSQWMHSNIGTEYAWNITAGSLNVTIAIIDTGVDWDHPDLSANIWNNTDEDCDNSTDLDNNGYYGDCRGYDFVNVFGPCWPGEDCHDEDNDPMDFFGHGTHTAGIAAAAGNNSIGIAGVCRNCSIMPVRAALAVSENAAYLFDYDIAQALKYAADNGANIISMSFGGPNSSLLHEAIDYAYNRGSVLIAAAGNSDSDEKLYPAAYDNVIAVAASNQNSIKAGFSSYGSWVDVAAPGVDILSTWFDDDYAYADGTSMATPVVSGIAGLLLSADRNMSNDEIRSIILSSVDKPGSSDYYIGTGRVNASKALEKNTTLIAMLNPELDAMLFSSPDIVLINGTAKGYGFANYSVEYGSGFYPENMTVINVSGEQINSSILAEWDISRLPNGYYTIMLKANHNSSPSYTFDSQYIVISDAIPPEINFSVPTPLNNSVTGNDWVFVNVTSDEPLALCMLDWYNGTWQNITMNKSPDSRNCWINMTNLTEIIYQFLVWGSDYRGNMNSSLRRQILVDLTPPDISIISPSSSIYGYAVSFNVSLSEAGNWCIYSLDNGLNITMKPNSSRTGFGSLNSSMEEGNHTVIFYCADMAGKINSTHALNFSVKRELSLGFASPTPQNQSLLNRSWIFVNVSGSTALNACILEFFNGSWANLSMTAANGSCYVNITNLTDYAYHFRAYGTDILGNSNVTGCIYITLDLTPPAVTPVSPENNYIWTSNSTPGFYFSVNDSSYIENCSITINGEPAETKYNITNNKTTGFFITLSNGIYFWNITCMDTAGNSNTSETRMLTVDFHQAQQKHSSGTPSGGGFYMPPPEESNKTSEKEEEGQNNTETKNALPETSKNKPLKKQRPYRFSPQVCIPNTTRCMIDSIELCSPDGHEWKTIKKCEFGCDQSMECKPESHDYSWIYKTAIIIILVISLIIVHVL